MCDIFRFSVLIDMGWKVFLPDRYIGPVEKKIHKIAGSLEGRIPDNGGLMGGKAGMACFYAYYADWSRNRDFDKLIADLIEDALNPAAGNFPGYQFSDGWSGIAWIIHQLSTTGLMDWDVATIFDDLDEHLYAHMMEEMRNGHYDYLHGALGTVLYFMRQPQNEKYRAYLTELLVELEKKGEKEADGSLKWLSTLDADKKILGYNLSLSHGMASVILILSMLHESKISEKLSAYLLKGSLKYLDKQKLPPDEYLSMFPSWARESTEELGHSRLGWCYGDLGSGMACLEAGAFLPGTKYKLDGLNILFNTANRKDPIENNVFDAGICHGASGIALFYNILYQKTELETFKEAAIYWLDICLNMAFHKDGIAGYKTWYAPEYGGWKNTPGLLEGCSGIGLVLLSFISEREPAWTRSLLLL